MPLPGRNDASSVSLVLTRSGWPGVCETMRAFGAPWTRRQLSQVVEAGSKFARRHQRLLPVLGLGRRAIWAAPEVSARCRRRPSATTKSMTDAVTSTSCALAEVTRLLMLHQPDVVLAMNRGQHIVPGEIQDDPSRISLHGLRP